MNLVRDPWIPILFGDGKLGSVSLRDAFLQGARIADLAVRPHERIALMRLLICIAQAALDGPADRQEWLVCREQIPGEADAYLSRWEHAFELFGERQRFLQLQNVKLRNESEPNTPITKLDLAMATEHNHTLFDNGGGTQREFEPAWAALALLTFQCFSPGGRIGVAEWAGELTGNGSSEAAPCISRSMLHTYLRGGDLAATIHLNLVPKERVQGLLHWGCPVWERFPQSQSDGGAIKNATETYLGRLVPISRAIRLWPGSASILNANGLTYPEGREAAATEVLKKAAKTMERKVVSASLEKASWRELSAITARRPNGGGPLTLQNLPEDEEFEIWAGGLVTSKGKAAKPAGTIESVFHLPAAMATERGPIRYAEGIGFADGTLQRLFSAVATYWREHSPSTAKKKNKEPRLTASRKTAEQFFWTALEQGVPDLLKGVDSDAPWHETAWGKLVGRTASESLKAACPSSTPRQIRAFAKALQVLFPEVKDGESRDRDGSEDTD